MMRTFYACSPFDGGTTSWAWCKCWCRGLCMRRCMSRRSRLFLPARACLLDLPSCKQEESTFSHQCNCSLCFPSLFAGTTHIELSMHSSHCNLAAQLIFALGMNRSICSPAGPGAGAIPSRLVSFFFAAAFAGASAGAPAAPAFCFFGAAFAEGAGAGALGTTTSRAGLVGLYPAATPTPHECCFLPQRSIAVR